jgi:hypothetical protein
VTIGTENRNKVIAAISLVTVAVALMAIRFSGMLGLGSSSAASPAPANIANNLPAERNFSAGAKTTGRNISRKQAASQSLDPTLHTDLLRSSEDTKYEGTGRNIFKVFVDIPKPMVPPAGAQQQLAQQQAPPQPPPPPPIELKYYGYATPQGGIKRIFLAQGEDVFIAKEGEIVDRRYKVVRISPNAVEILDVLSNNRQSIPLTSG